jgi:predicted permease
MSTRPPRLAEWLHACSLPRDSAEHEAVLGDLAEEYGQRIARDGVGRARRWYWRETARSLGHNVRRRLAADRRRGAAGKGGWMTTMSGIRTDARIAGRSLMRRPGFAVMAALTMAIGIGASAAVFTVVDAAVLHGLDVPEQDRVVSVWGVFDRFPGDEFGISLAELSDLMSDVRSFERVGAWFPGRTLLEPRDAWPARTITVASTVGDVYSIVAATVVLGRLPDANDSRPGAPPVAMLSHALWRDAFGGDPRVIDGGTLPVGASRIPIVGVLAPDAMLPGTPAAAWIHTVLNPASWAANRSGHGQNVIARLRDGVGAESAQAELASLESTWAARYAGQHSFGIEGHGVRLLPLAERLLGQTRRMAILLAMAVGVLLALACANVASLFLARGESRAPDVGVRMALGASNRRVVQPVVFEALLIAVVGGMLGLALAIVGLPAMLRAAPAELTASMDGGFNSRVALFAAVVSIVAGLVFAYAPARRATRESPAHLLNAAGRSRTSATRGLRALAAGQMGLATALLIVAALLTTSLLRLTSVEPGLQPASRVALDLRLPVRYNDLGAIMAFYDAARERLSAIPGVDRVAALKLLPLRDMPRREGVVPEHAAGVADRLGVSVQAATDDMLRTLGIPLIDGRDIEPGDRPATAHVALVNESAARTLWPGESAIGKRFRATFLPASYGPITVVGVYGDVRTVGLSVAPAPEITLPAAQVAAMGGWVRDLTVVLQAAGGSFPALAASAREVIRQIDPGGAVESPTTIEDVVRASSARARFVALFISTFSAAALLIAAVGVFGVVSFSVARQTREFAIRHALGASRLEILAGVLRSTAMIALGGAVVGAGVVGAAAPAIRGFLYGMSPANPAILIGAPVALVLVAMAAALPAAVAAMRVPLTAALQEH